MEQETKYLNMGSLLLPLGMYVNSSGCHGLIQDRILHLHCRVRATGANSARSLDSKGIPRIPPSVLQSGENPQ